MLFSDTTIEVSSGTISINVKERWTLFVLPFTRSEKGQASRYGGFLIENNLFGFGKKLIIGTTFSHSQTTYYLNYIDPSIFFSEWDSIISVGRSQKVFYRYRGEDRIDGMDEEERILRLSLGYRFTPQLTCSVIYEDIQKNYNYLAGYTQPENFNPRSAGVKLQWKDTRFAFYFQEGFYAGLLFMHQLERNDEAGREKEKSYRITATLQEQKQVLKSSVIQIELNGAYLQGGDMRDAIYGGGENGLRGIPSDGVWVRKYLSVAIDYQIPILRRPGGTFTTAPFIDAGVLQEWDVESEYIRFYSYGIGMYYFLKEMALPGFGLQIGSNKEYEKFFISFRIGF